MLDSTHNSFKTSTNYYIIYFNIKNTINKINTKKIYKKPDSFDLFKSNFNAFNLLLSTLISYNFLLNSI